MNTPHVSTKNFKTIDTSQALENNTGQIARVIELIILLQPSLVINLAFDSHFDPNCTQTLIRAILPHHSLSLSQRHLIHP